MDSFPTFSGHVISGDGRGKSVLGTPTINLEPSDVPVSIPHGVYAAVAQVNEHWLPASVHYGVRPTFGASLSFEVHVLGTTIATPPAALQVRLLEHLRDIKKCDTTEALKEAIDDDIRRTRAIVAKHSA